MTEPKTIFQVFADVKRKVRPVGKDSKNEQQHFNFRGIDAVVNAAAGALDEYGVITCPIVEDAEYTTVEVGQRRTLMAQVRVKVTYRFYGPAGDYFDAVVPGEAMDSGDKGTAKAMSVAYRIALLQALNLPTSETDPDSQSYERSPARDESWRDQPPVNRQQRQEQPEPAQDAADPAQWESAEPDEEAQEMAGLAHEARTVSEISALHAKATDARKLSKVIANPATGGKGELGKYLTWRRTQLQAEHKALAELNTAGKRAGLEGDVLDERVKELVGVGIEDATVAQMKEATTALAKQAS